MRSMREANVDYVRVGPGEYVNVSKKNLPQLFSFLFGCEGADISVLIWPAQEYWLGSIANCSLSSLKRIVIAILGTMIRWLNCRIFCLSHTPVPTADSIRELLTGCSRGQSIRHWSSN